MSHEKIVLLDGTRPGDTSLEPVLARLLDVLKASGAAVQVYPLRELKLAHCIGCFGCWVETPGLCRYGEAGRDILRAVIQSDTIVPFTPVTFGGYSSQLKQILDRFASLVLPYFRADHGETHHDPRYARYPRWVGIGVQPQPNATEAQLFRLLVGRNAINFHAPSFAAEVVTTRDGPDRLRETFWSLLTRKDLFPWGDAVKTLSQAPDAPSGGQEPGAGRRALLVVGSPKTLSPSTSSVLGSYVLERLKARGWETEALTLKPSLCAERGQDTLLAAVDRTDLLLFASPLYIDSLPYLVIKALELITEHRRVVTTSKPQRLAIVTNNGFVEAYQNNLALSIYRRFAAANGLVWAGALAMGVGEAISGGQPLKPVSAEGVPCAHIMAALDGAAAALAQCQAVPPEAARGIAQSPIPKAPFWVWRWMATYYANQGWDRRAAANGVNKQRILERPYAARPSRLEAALSAFMALVRTGSLATGRTNAAHAVPVADVRGGHKP